ncbi:hypothetical protein FRC04_003580 [Tulasnella sp. 424]|nr:hypothetical protein FRC04_003580 [Tulasnella sp. 424]
MSTSDDTVRDTLLSTPIVGEWTLSKILSTEATNLVKLWEDGVRDKVEYGGGIYIKDGGARPFINSAKGNNNNINIERFRAAPQGSKILVEFHTHPGKQPKDGRPSDGDVSNHWDRTSKNPGDKHAALVVTTTNKPSGGWGKRAVVKKQYAVVVWEDASKDVRIWAMPRLTAKPDFNDT